MFSKGNKAQTRDNRADTTGKSVPSIISSDLSITGDLASSGEIQVDGSIDGDIHCKSLIIGVSGSVTGEIEADSIRLHGKISGQVRAKTVYLAATARMVGDIWHESLAIEPGAFMEGHCRRLVEGAMPDSVSASASAPNKAVDAMRKPDLKIAGPSADSQDKDVRGAKTGDDDSSPEKDAELATG